MAARLWPDARDRAHRHRRHGRRPTTAAADRGQRRLACSEARQRPYDLASALPYSSHHRLARADSGFSRERSQRKATPMDLSKYIGSTFLKLADVEHNPIEGHVADVVEGKYGLNLVLESGDTINLNKTNART